MDRSTKMSSARVRGLANPEGDRHAEGSHPVEDVASELRLRPLIWQNAGVKLPADDCFVPIHRGLDQAPAVVAGATLPTHTSMLADDFEMPVALRCRGLA